MEYTFEKKLYSTLCGDIYSARDEFGGSVAIKVSKMCASLNGENPMNEGIILKRLASLKEDEGKKYILKMFDKFYVNCHGVEFCCLIVEMGNGDLLERVQAGLAKEKRLSFREVRQHFMQIAQGVYFLHKNGISHLDLSLENILVLNEEIRICDFGQAETQRFFKAQKSRKGKLKYQCPEIYNYQDFDGYKADVWSLGVMLWAMLTGSLLYNRPHDTDSNFRYLTKGQDGIEKLLREQKVYDVPSCIIEGLAKMLSVDPKNRWTIAEVLAHNWDENPKPMSNKWLKRGSSTPQARKSCVLCKKSTPLSS
jgi:serine/threonine protein kinase